MSDGNLKFYLSGGVGGAHTKFFEAPALTDAEGNPVGMSIEGWGGIGDINAGLRFFPNPWLAVGVRVGGTFQGGSVDVVDTIDSDNPDAYYAAAECDKYVEGAVGNVGSAGNCGVGDPLDASQFNWDRGGVSIFFPLTFRPGRFQLEVAPGVQREWGTGNAHIMIPSAEGFVGLNNLDSLRLEASLGAYFGNPEETQVGASVVWRGTLRSWSQGEVFVPGEDRYEAIPGARNHVLMARVEVEFDTDRKEGAGRPSTTDRAAERARKTREREEARARREAERAAARTSDPTTTTMTEDWARKKVTTDFAATMTRIGATRVAGSDTDYLYARGEINFSVAFIGKNTAKDPKTSALVLDSEGEPTDFGYVIMKQDVHSLQTAQLKNPDGTYLTFAQLRVPVLRRDFVKQTTATAATTTMTEAEAIDIMNGRMQSAMNDIRATRAAEGYYSVVERGTKFIFKADYVLNPTNNPKVSALILDDAGAPTGHGYIIKINVGATAVGNFIKNNGTFYTFEDTAKIFKDPHAMDDMFGLEVRSSAPALPTRSPQVPKIVAEQIENDMRSLPQAVRDDYRELLYDTNSLEPTKFESYFRANRSTESDNMASFSTDFVADLQNTISDTEHFLIVATGLRIALAQSTDYTYDKAEDLLLDLDDAILSELESIEDDAEFSRMETLVIEKHPRDVFGFEDPLLKAITDLERARRDEADEGPSGIASATKFPNPSIPFTIGSPAIFTHTGVDATQIDHIEWHSEEGAILDSDVDYSISATTLTVTELAAISSKVRADTIAALPTDATSVLRGAADRNAGKGIYTLVVILDDDDETKITLTATAK